MKKINLFALLISSLLLFSCGGDDGDGGGSATPAGNSLSANISGAVSAKFSASGEVQGQPLVVVTLASSGALSIVGNDGSGSSMTLGITEYDGAGTYSLDIQSINTASFVSVTLDGQTPDTKGFTATSGSVEITLDGDTINGTFSFNGEGNDGTIEVTKGTFSVTPE